MVAGTRGDVVDQSTGNGDFALRSFAEADTYGVADAVGKQGSDADSRLDATVLAVAGLGDAEVDGVGHPFGFHLAHQQTYGDDHDDGVACLDGDDDVVELLVAADTQKLHAGLHHAGRCVAIARHDAVGE